MDDRSHSDSSGRKWVPIEGIGDARRDDDTEFRRRDQYHKNERGVMHDQAPNGYLFTGLYDQLHRTRYVER